MSNSQGVAEKALATTFDTVTTVQHVASDVALNVADTFRLKPLVFWGVVGAAVAVIAIAVAATRR